MILITTNIGTITGGTATNVVAERCSIVGEVREFDPRPIDAHLTLPKTTFESVASRFGGTVEFTSREDFPPFRLDPDGAVIRMTDDVLRSVGLNPHGIEYLGGSDANMLNAKGIPSVNLGIGAQNPHGDDEFILVPADDGRLAIISAVYKVTVSGSKDLGDAQGVFEGEGAGAGSLQVHVDKGWFSDYRIDFKTDASFVMKKGADRLVEFPFSYSAIAEVILLYAQAPDPIIR